MSKNVGSFDRILRIVIGAALIAAAFTLLAGGVGQWIALGAGVIALGTALIGFCPAYRLVGLRTCPMGA